ncbi:MAG TPA: GNAT family N-acetyltransferase [Myxococcota bacterium]|nr:GNAT family N-acetyltransferase [Myxococcota bacterium]
MTDARLDPSSQLAPEAREILLADGGSARIRGVTPEDAPRLEVFHRSLSEETIHYRYFSAVARLPPFLLRRFTQVDFARDMVLVAEVADRVIALASYHRQKTGDTAEVAFVVADAHQGRGLGTLLLDELAELARARGVTRFVAQTLSNNREMLRVFSDSGHTLERGSESGVVSVTFPTADTASVRSAREWRWHRAEVQSVSRLVRPRGVLLVGGWAERAFEPNGFAGAIYTDLRSSPRDVDLAVYAGAAAPLPELVGTLASLGVHALLLGALDGLDAADHAHFDPELRVAIRRHGMRAIGPGSLGLLNPAQGLWLWTAGTARAARPGGLAIACDAGREALVQQALEADIRVSTVLSLGRRADVSVNDLLEFWQDDPGTESIALALRSPGRAEKFLPLAARVASKKRVLALASGDARCDAALRDAGLTLFETEARLLEWLR